eukprot:jgi/Picre1/28669/NNA_004069.t1
MRGLCPRSPLIGGRLTEARQVCFYEDSLAKGLLPPYLPSLLMPTAPFDLTSFALALLLVFRTNTSYDRWLEVCTVWSGLGNRSRDTMRQCISHISDGSGAMNPLSAAMCRWVIAYCRALKCEVMENSDLAAELKDVLTPKEASSLLKARHRPSFAVSILTELGAAAPLRESHRIRLDENLTYFEDAVGSCEADPDATDSSELYPAYITLHGIDEIGVQIEEPFGLLPLDDICDEIEGDLFSMLREGVDIKKTAQAARLAAMGNQEEMDALEMTPFSPLPRVAVSRDESGSSSMHKEWDEVTGRSSLG